MLVCVCVAAARGTKEGSARDHGREHQGYGQGCVPFEEDNTADVKVAQHLLATSEAHAVSPHVTNADVPSVPARVVRAHAHLKLEAHANALLHRHVVNERVGTAEFYHAGGGGAGGWGGSSHGAF